MRQGAEGGAEGRMGIPPGRYVQDMEPHKTSFPLRLYKGENESVKRTYLRKMGFDVVSEFVVVLQAGHDCGRQAQRDQDEPGDLHLASRWMYVGKQTEASQKENVLIYTLHFF